MRSKSIALFISFSLTSVAPLALHVEYSHSQSLATPDWKRTAQGQGPGVADAAIKEWTAMGDSYAVGIGAGSQLKFLDLCYRFNQSYGEQLQYLGLDPTPSTFTYVACSGNTFQEIIDNQLRDTPHCDYTHVPPICWPAWGKNPSFVTLSMGGNDIGIFQLVQTCITNFQTRGMDCDDVIDESLAKIGSAGFQTNATQVVQAALTKGVRTYGASFHVYVLGYAQFFNATTTQCNRISLQPPLSRRDPSDVFLTQERRARLNNLALALNAALGIVVDAFPRSSVTWVDYDAQFTGHRFCDREEANADDPLTWFFSWNTTVDPRLQLGGAPGTTLPSLGEGEAVIDLFTRAGFYNATDPINGTTAVVEDDISLIQALVTAAGNDTEMENLIWKYVRIFHPKSPGHQAIEQVLRPHIASVVAGSVSTSR